MNKEYNFVVGKPILNFKCDWGVYAKGNDSSICYTTNKFYSKLVAISLERFMNSEEGEQWMKKNY